MAKRTDPLVAALENGQPYTWTVPDGGDLASRAVIKHGQTLTMTPVGVAREVQVGDVEDMRWYADRIGKERWSKAPRQNVWSFEQRLWNLTKRVREKDSNFARQIHNYIDRGKVCVGLVAELVKL